MSLYKGFRHERSKGEDGLRINYWYLIRPDGGEDLAVIGREIKGSGGHYNYNSAPLFGMLSWVNSSEVRRWLQTKIADPQSLRCTSSGQDLLSNSMSRPNSDAQLTGAQDGMPGLPLTSHHSDHAWALPSHMMPPGGRQPELPPMHGNLGPALFRNTPAGDGPVPDAHERNAMIGHTLSAVDALLVALRRRAGIEYSLTLVTREREVHVLGSAGTRWRPSSEQTASPYHSVDVSSSSGLAWNAEGLDAHHQGNAYVPGPAQVPNSTAPPPASSEGMVLRGGSLAEPELQAARDSAHSFEMPGEAQEEALTPTWQLQTKRALSDLWNLSELEESRKRSGHDGSSHMRLNPDAHLINSEPLSDPLDPADPSLEHCLQ